MKPQRVLIIEDDPSIAELLSIHLRDLQLEPDVCSSGAEGLSRALSEEYSLIVLDLMLPELNGKEVLKGIRKIKTNIPILVLTLKAEVVDKVVGFELGADDYMTKPFSIHELLARVKALLRRFGSSDAENTPLANPESLRFENLLIEESKRKVFVNDKAIDLTVKQFDLLLFLARHPGRPFTRSNLLNSVWGYENSGYEHTVDTHINRLRAQLEPEPGKPRYILTVWGVGYRFAELHELRGKVK